MVARGQDQPGRHPNETLLLEALNEFDAVESSPLTLCKPSLQNNQDGIRSAQSARRLSSRLRRYGRGRGRGRGRGTGRVRQAFMDGACFNCGDLEHWAPGLREFRHHLASQGASSAAPHLTTPRLMARHGERSRSDLHFR